MKKVINSIAAGVFVIGLTACGTSAEVKALEDLIVKAETDVKACDGKKGNEMTDCVMAVMNKANSEWSKQVNKASQDDPEAVAELANRYTALTNKTTEMMTNAFN